MKRFVLWTIIVVVLCMILLGSTWVFSQEQEDEFQNQKVLNKLKNMKISPRFQETPFIEAIDFIRDVTGLNMVIDPPLREEVRDEEIEVNLKVRDVAIENVLKLVLEQSGKPITFIIEEGIINICNEEDIEQDITIQTFRGQIFVIAKGKKKSHLAIYEIHDLLQEGKIKDYPGPIISLTPKKGEGGGSLGLGGGGGGGMSGFSFDDDEEEENEMFTPEGVEELVSKALGLEEEDW